VLNVTPFAEFETDYLKAAWILLQESGQVESDRFPWAAWGFSTGATG
jgi:hypothetical protein